MRIFRQAGKLNKLEWRIWVDGETVHTESGIVGGRMKHTCDRPGPVGKFGTGGYKDAKTQALLVADRQIRDKVERLGYAEVTDKNDPQVEQKLNFSNPPKNTRFMKCRHQPEPGTREMRELETVIDFGEEICTFKRDGMMHPIFIDDTGTVRIFTRRMDLCTDNYPHLAKEISQADFPPNSILLTELVVTKDGRDDRKLVQTLDRSLPDRSRRIQEDPFRRPKAIVLGIPYWNSTPIMSIMPVCKWIDFLYAKIGVKNYQYMEPMEVMEGYTIDELMKIVEEEKREGLVIYDSQAVFGNAVVNFRGREERPRAWKWKPILEGDFVVVFDPDGSWGEEVAGAYGRGKLRDLPGMVALYQYDRHGKLQYICNCGSGFTEDQRKYALRKAANNRGIVGVARIKYESRTFISEGDDTNALTMPIFLEWHPDKSENEAFDDRL